MYFHGPWHCIGLLPPPPSPIATLLEITKARSLGVAVIIRASKPEHPNISLEPSSEQGAFSGPFTTDGKAALQ